MAPSSSKFIISDKAYLKVALHAAKHPHAVVTGVLVGAKAEAKGPSGDVWRISDAIPILHHWTNLSPMMEVALELVRNHCGKAGLEILGLYHSTESINNTDISPVGQQILESLTTTFPAAFAFTIDANRIPLGQPLFKIHMVQQKSSQPADTFDLENDESPSRALQAIRQRGLQTKLGDFDDHLEDISVDWLKNPDVSD